jgi:hypothetical protein
MREQRSLKSFGEVANEDVNVKANVNKEANINNNLKNDLDFNHNATNNFTDELDDILSSKENKNKTHILKGIYFERDLAKAIDKVTKGKGKGAKSEIINAIVKKAFKEKGWLE